MERNPILSFREGVKEFKTWVKKNNKFFGEWETDYPHWLELYNISEELLKEIPFEKWDLELIHDFLYLLARDNELEEILFYLINSPNTLLELAKHAVSFHDYDARWQIAHGLGEVNGDQPLIQNLLNEFLKDEHEYVQRRALFAIDKKISVLFNQVYDSLIEKGYKFGLVIEVYSNDDIGVEYIITNKQANESERKEVKSIFLGIVERNNLDPNLFNLKVSDAEE